MREWIGDRVINELKDSGYMIANKDFEDNFGVKRTDYEDDNLGLLPVKAMQLAQEAAELPDDLVYKALREGFTNTCHDNQNFFDTDHPVYEKHDGTGTVTTVSNYDAGSDAPWFLLDASRALKPLIYQNRQDPRLTSMISDEDERVFMSNEFRWGVDCRGNAGYGLWHQAFASSKTLNADNFNDAVARMQSLKADGGRVLNVSPTILLVRPQDRVKAHEIVKAAKVDGKDNPNLDLVKVITTPKVII